MLQWRLFDEEEYIQLCEELFAAYYACRSNKRNKLQALHFERNLEANLFLLADEIFSGEWRPAPSQAFLVTRPVRREVFAATFRDRIVHHWLMAHLNPHFEAMFIVDSYACRTGKGTHFGINRLKSHLKEEPMAWVLRLDIQGFFMNIHRQLLWRRLDDFIICRMDLRRSENQRIHAICELLACWDATRGAKRRGPLQDWRLLPRDKSLFTTPPGCGLPIGNLTSQTFANFFLHPLDVFIQQDLGINSYGRYVDDLYIVDGSKERLKACIPQIRDFLQRELQLRLHPRKIHLQQGCKGAAFLGAVVWPGYSTPGKRLKGNFYDAVSRLIAGDEDEERARAIWASYTGMLKHHRAQQFLQRQAVRLHSGAMTQRTDWAGAPGTCQRSR
jgi:hypothetical protein